MSTVIYEYKPIDSVTCEPSPRARWQRARKSEVRTVLSPREFILLEGRPVTTIQAVYRARRVGA